MNHCPIFEKIPVIKVFLQLHGTGKWAFMVISIAFHSRKANLSASCAILR